jgi:hypothetical protein
MQPALRKRGMSAASAPVVDSAELIREGSAGCDGCSEAISAQTNHNGGPQRLTGLSMGAPPAHGGAYQFILAVFRDRLEPDRAKKRACANRQYSKY